MLDISSILSKQSIKFIIIFIVIQIIFLLLRYKFKIVELQEKIKMLQFQYDTTKDVYEKRIKDLLNTNNKNYDKLKQEINHINALPKDIINVFKYAMKVSHPDNGGNEKDFKKIRKIYEELTKNNGG